MSLSVTVATIQERVRNRLALPVYSTDTTVTTAEILEFVITSSQLLSGLIGRSYGNGYFDTSTTLVTQAGLPFVSLPTDFTYLINAYWLISSTSYMEIEEAQSNEILPTGYAAQAWNQSGLVPKMRLKSGTIEFYPTPSAAYNVVLNYTTGIVPTSTASVLPLQAGWDEWIVLDVCVKCRQKEQKDAADFIYDRDRIEAMIVSNAKPRDKRKKRIADRRNDTSAMRGTPIWRWR